MSLLDKITIVHSMLRAGYNAITDKLEILRSSGGSAWVSVKGKDHEPNTWKDGNGDQKSWLVAEGGALYAKYIDCIGYNSISFIGTLGAGVDTINVYGIIDASDSDPSNWVWGTKLTAIRDSSITDTKDSNFSGDGTISYRIDGINYDKLAILKAGNNEALAFNYLLGDI